MGSAAKWRKDYTSKLRMYNREEIAKQCLAANKLIDELFLEEVVHFEEAQDEYLKVMIQ